ncbi:MAG TPA: hypothetical protein VMV52_08550 [Candidatus Nanopelagicaceae bacterium]|nr:hypothetical protein [Candidatus Nanopelagicaceae bacterium]
MNFVTPASLLIALIISAPSLWQGWSDSSVDISTVLTRFLLAVLLSSVGLRLLRTIVESYRRGAGRPVHRPVELPRSEP